MALISCCECGKQVSEKANACPNCGAPVEVTSILPLACDRRPFQDVSDVVETITSIAVVVADTETTAVVSSHEEMSADATSVCPNCLCKDRRLAPVVHAEGTFAINLETHGMTRDLAVGTGGASVSLGRFDRKSQGTRRPLNALPHLAQGIAPPLASDAEHASTMGKFLAVVAFVCAPLMLKEKIWLGIAFAILLVSCWDVSQKRFATATARSIRTVTLKHSRNTKLPVGCTQGGKGRWFVSVAAQVIYRTFSTRRAKQ